MTDHIPDNR